MRSGDVFLRRVVALIVLVITPAICNRASYSQESGNDSHLVKIATFDVDATPPVGSDMAYDPVKRLGELSLRSRGIVILGSGKPIVLCAVDWIGIANEGHDAFRAALAKAAETTPDRVAVHALHQHDAPGCDFTAERILRELGQGNIGRFEGTFHRQVIEQTAKAVKASISIAQKASHFGWGVAKVEKVASNRRILGADGRVRAVRYTTTRDPALRAEPEGVIDPEISVLSFWNEDKPISLLSYFACHPQSYYRTGIPSPDFPGIARFVQGESIPHALLVHFNGAGGNIGAGKYNDGAKENRMKLALRLADGMKNALEATEKKKLSSREVGWNFIPVQLPPAKHLDRAKLIEAIKTNPIKGYIDKADQLAWLQRCHQNKTIDISCLRIGDARILHMPGELFIEYQLKAKAMRPDLNVAMAAYGDYGPGYIGTKIAYSEGGYETSARASNVSPDSEEVLTEAMAQLLETQNQPDSELNPSEPRKSEPLSPKEALKTFEVHDGFEMQLVASEPNIQEPIVISYDEDGRMYVAEYLKFPAKNGKSDGPDGRIKLLTDQNKDGHYETSVVFADKLAWPTGICPWKGGVFVIAAPDLWYLKDTDGDGRADIRQKVFTGFGFSNEEGTANNLTWGLDHWIYGAGSNSGGDIRPADQSSAKPVSIRGSDFRFHPVTMKFEAISGSEQFGNTFDDWGNRFICQNSKPAVHVVLPARYLARNPYLSVPSVLSKTWDAENVFRSSAPEQWRVDRTKYRKSQKRKWAAPFVEHDVFTACSGITIYRGDQGSDFRGNLFVGDVQSNLVHRRTLKPNGATFRSLRADTNTEVIRSTENWFRPVNLCNGPDGTLHIVDMCRDVIETPDSLPEEILANVNLQRGHEHGRIYRLAPKGFTNAALPQLSSRPMHKLVEQLESRNGWIRTTTSRIIFERQDLAASEPLRNIVRYSDRATARLHALYALYGLRQLRVSDVISCLRSDDPRLREHAVRAAEFTIDDHDLASEGSTRQSKRDTETYQSLVDRLIDLTSDPSPRVRFQLAFTLGQIEDDRAAEALYRLAIRKSNDPWTQTAILSSSLNHAFDILQLLVRNETFRKSSNNSDFIKQLSTVVGGRNRTDEVKPLLEYVDTIAGNEDDSWASILVGLGDGLRHSRSSLTMHVGESTPTAKMISKMARWMTGTLNSSTQSSENRIRAIKFLVNGDWEEVGDALESNLGSHNSPAIQLAIVHAMSSFSNEDVAKSLINKWPELSPTVRGELIESLLGRVQWTKQLLVAIEQGLIPHDSIPPLRWSQLCQDNEESLRSLARKLLESRETESLVSSLEHYKPATKLQGNPKNGAVVFKENCMSCHRAKGKGHEVGPNLATIQNQTPADLLVEILDPNRNIQADYMQYVVLTTDGRLVSGMIATESPTSITLKRAEGIEETVLRQNIEEIRASGKSLMPEGLGKNINVQQMSDLIAYLRSL